MASIDVSGMAAEGALDRAIPYSRDCGPGLHGRYFGPVPFSVPAHAVNRLPELPLSIRLPVCVIALAAIGMLFASRTFPELPLLAVFA